MEDASKFVCPTPDLEEGLLVQNRRKRSTAVQPKGQCKFPLKYHDFEPLPSSSPVHVLFVP